MEIRLVRPEEINQAAAVLLLGRPRCPSSMEKSYGELLARLKSTGMDFSRQIVAVKEGEVLASCAFTQVDPTSAHVIAPAMLPSVETENIKLERGMIECAVAEARRLGAKLVQTVLEKEDWPRQTAFRDAGFEPLAELSFMERHPQRADCAMEAPPWLRFITYEKDREGVFLDVIRSTYEGTLDCPALSSLRTAEETLEGHKRSGKFDPLMWFLAFDKRNTPVGVLLLNLMEISDRFNVTFMGVVAEFRGRGLGMAFVKYALRRICETHRTVLTLAVDTRNWPACRIYKEAGFVETARKEVLYRYF